MLLLDRLIACELVTRLQAGSSWEPSKLYLLLPLSHQYSALTGSYLKCVSLWEGQMLTAFLTLV